ncbi:MAG TPA: ABC transporter ATP-binding protein [Ignavibacteria bacterium]|nr:ABC transporter ATP-binding protein [Ignavibacteria bacterium]HMQ99458.1 ABC transporter ATP-binding protein [Ignavibacteria bacterium]
MVLLAVKMNGITKTFGDNFKANDSVDLNVKAGEIHALVGENGAGKSTLMNILYGMYHPDEGTITINGNNVSIHSPAEAIKLGIGMVHQHFMLVSTLSVLENIILGDEITGAFDTVDIRRCRQKVKSILNSFDISIDLDETTGRLPVGTQQKIEILKLLYRNADILILDEPTAVLTPRETDELFRTLRELKKEGKTIILITHKLGEVLEVSDMVTVLRRGKVTGVLQTAKTGRTELSELIIGEKFIQQDSKTDNPGARIILEVSGLMVKNERSFPAVRDVSFEISAGEILGIAGVEGNGQTELIEAVCGLRKIESGSIKINGREITRNTAIAHIPANRHKHGMVAEYSLSENILLGRENEPQFSGTLLLKKNAIDSFTDNLIEEYDIRPRDNNTLISGLSGGNQQKVVAAREMTKQTDVIAVSHPARGLDIKAANFVYKTLLGESKKGKAILLVSSDLGELLKLSDRIAVMYNGKFAVVLNAKQTNEREIGEFMLGVKDS